MLYKNIIRLNICRQINIIRQFKHHHFKTINFIVNLYDKRCKNVQCKTKIYRLEIVVQQIFSTNFSQRQKLNKNKFGSFHLSFPQCNFFFRNIL